MLEMLGKCVSYVCYMAEAQTFFQGSCVYVLRPLSVLLIEFERQMDRVLYNII